MTTFPSWDSAEGERLREEALRHVRRGADVAWMKQALAAVQYSAESWPQIDTDHVWGVLEDVWQARKPRERRAMGPIMQHAVVAEWISPTGRWIRSERPACHRRWIAVYDSNIYGRRKGARRGQP